MTMLSPHFSLSELSASAYATRLAIDNSPPPLAQAALQALAERVLEPVREIVRAHTGKASIVVINSGFRSPQVNRAVGGQSASQHQLGQAADIEVPGLSTLDLARLIAASSIPFDQLILEFHVSGQPASGWVHVSYVQPKKPTDPPRRIVRTASRVQGSVQYSAGLPA